MENNPKHELVRLFRRNGCLRLPLENRLAASDNPYKKGYEVRMVALDEKEALLIPQLLEKTGFRHGNPYKKRSCLVFPIYGKEPVERFRKLLSEIQPARQG